MTAEGGKFVGMDQFRYLSWACSLKDDRERAIAIELCWAIDWVWYEDMQRTAGWLR